MKYINKSVAENTAFNMLKENRDKITEKEKALSEVAEAFIIKTFDAETYEIVKSLPSGWIETKSSFNVSGNGFGHLWVRIKQSIRVPHISYTIDIPRKEYDKLDSMKTEIKEMQTKLESIKSQIVATLLKLRTAQKIQKEFPEAFKFLPKDAMQVNDLIALPIKSILENIEKLSKINRFRN